MRTTTSPTARPVSRAPRSGWVALRRWLLVAVLFFAILAPVGAAFDILRSARAYETTPTDAIAVLGASQYWGTPSPVFSNRLDHARDLWGQGVAPLIITVGGKIDGDITTEAEAGRAYLIRAGVPASQVVALPEGRDTIESLQFVEAEMRERGLRSVTVVSDRLHLARSKAIAEDLGLEVHVSGRAFADGSSFVSERFLRELGGLLRFQVWDRWFVAPLDEQG